MLILSEGLRYDWAQARANRHNSALHNDYHIARIVPLKGYKGQEEWLFAIVCLACPDIKEDTWESLGREIIDFPEPDQTYGADEG